MKSHILFLLGWLIIVLPYGMPFIFPAAKVNLTPDSVDRCTTENQTMECEVVDEDYNVSDIVFQLNGKQVEADDVEIVDSRKAQIHLHNLSREMNNLNVLCCVDNCGSFDATSVQVYVKPVHVEELTCIIYDYTMNVTCTWNYAANYILRDIWPNVTLHIGLLDTVSVINWNIPDLQTRREFTNSSEFKYFNQPEVTISLSVKSKCGMESWTKFDGVDVVKVEPKPVSKFVSIALNSTCIHLSWVHNRKTYTKSYSIYTQSVWENKQVYLNESVFSKNISAYTVCDLIPGTEYSFEIKVKPLKKPGIWSVPMVTRSKTAKEVPGSSPSVTYGGYSWKRKHCQNGQSLRVVNIYWQPIPAIHFHGVMIGTRINFISDEGIDSMFLQDLSANFTEKQLSCFKTYNVTLQAENDVGPSVEPSSIFISAADTDNKILDLSELKAFADKKLIDVTNDLRVERNVSNNNTVYLEWNGNVQSETVSTIFYTEENGPEPDCGAISKGQANWVTFSPGATSGTITLPVGKEPEDYCYARAVETQGKSSGFEWSSCIYMGDIAPSRSPSDLQVTVGNKDNTLVLTWSKWLCPKGEPYVSHYEISYCPHGQNLNVTDGIVVLLYPREETSTVLSDLNSEQQYDIRIRGLTRYGAAGPWSEAVSGQPVDNSLKSGTIAGIAVGCAFAATIIIAAIVCFFRRCSRQAKRKLNDMRMIEIPQIHPGTLSDKPRYVNSENNNVKVQSADDSDDRKSTELSLNVAKPTPQRQNSDDSGVPEDPLTPPINDVARMERIPEDYSKAVAGFQNNGYSRPDGLTIAHVANCNLPTQPDISPDSYVKVDHMMHINALPKDGSPILVDEGEEDGNKFGNDNTAFTDDQGNHGNNITKVIQLPKKVSEVTIHLIDKPFHATQTDIRIGNVTTADTKTVYKLDIEGLRKQILLTNPSTPRVGAPESNAETENQSGLKSNSADSLSAVEDNMEEGGVSSYVDVADQRFEASNGGVPVTGYISQTSFLLNNNPDAHTSELSVPIQSTSNDVTNMDGYVDGKCFEGPNIAHSEVQNQSQAQTEQPNHSLHDNLYSKANMSANMPVPVTVDQTSVTPASQDHYVSDSFLRNQATILPTLNGLVSQPSQYGQSETDKNMTDYVPHSFILNNTAKQQHNADYVLHTDIPKPMLHMDTTSDATSSRPSSVITHPQNAHDNLQMGYIDSSALENIHKNSRDSNQIKKSNHETEEKADLPPDEDDVSKEPEVSSDLLSSQYVIIENDRIRPAPHEGFKAHNKEGDLQREYSRKDSGIDDSEDSL